MGKRKLVSGIDEKHTTSSTEGNIDIGKPILIRFKIPKVTTSTVVEAYSLAAVRKHIEDLPEGTIAVTDLDNTIMQPVQLAGTDQWFEAYLKRNMEQFKDSPDQAKLAFAKTLDWYNYAQTHTEVQTVEKEETLEFLNELHEEHRAVIALTNRGKELVGTTLKQLASIGVSFNDADLVRNKTVNLSEQLPDCPTSFATNGVIFTGGRPKAPCLKAYLEAIGTPLSSIPHIIFIDDKRHHVDAIANAAKEAGVSHTCIHYRHLDHKISNVNLSIAETQILHHKKTGIFLTDAETEAALGILESSESSTHKTRKHKTRLVA